MLAPKGLLAAKESNEVDELLTPKIVLPVPNVAPFVGDVVITPPPKTGGLPNPVAFKINC